MSLSQDRKIWIRVKPKKHGLKLGDLSVQRRKKKRGPKSGIESLGLTSYNQLKTSL